MKKYSAQRIARLGLLTALALIAGYVELLIPIPIGIPGVKLGLANLVVVWAMYEMRPADALLVNVVRVALAGLMFGSLSMILYSLCGAFLSYICMYLAKRRGIFGIMGVSIIGGVAHNTGQLLVAMAVLETGSLIYYGPVLLAAGVITGALIGIVAGEIRRRIPGK